MMRQFSARILRLGLIIALCLAGVGCGQSGPEMVKVSGKVLLNGAGVTAGSVYFHPSAENTFQDDVPSGQLQLDGTFVVKTFPFGEGVPPGRYKVTLSPELANRLKQPSYGAKLTTPWDVDVVSPATAALVLEITSDKDAAAATTEVKSP